jgi:hypothetical protein
MYYVTKVDLATKRLPSVPVCSVTYTYIPTMRAVATYVHTRVKVCRYVR